MKIQPNSMTTVLFLFLFVCFCLVLTNTGLTTTQQQLTELTHNKSNKKKVPYFPLYRMTTTEYIHTMYVKHSVAKKIQNKFVFCCFRLVLDSVNCTYNKLPISQSIHTIRKCCTDTKKSNCTLMNIDID